MIGGLTVVTWKWTPYVWQSVSFDIRADECVELNSNGMLSMRIFGVSWLIAEPIDQITYVAKSFDGIVRDIV